MALPWGCHRSTYRSVGGRLGIAMGNANSKHALVNRPRALPLHWGIGRPRTSAARVAAPWPAFGRDNRSPPLEAAVPRCLGSYFRAAVHPLSFAQVQTLVIFCGFVW